MEVGDAHVPPLEWGDCANALGRDFPDRIALRRLSLGSARCPSHVAHGVSHKVPRGAVAQHWLWGVQQHPRSSHGVLLRMPVASSTVILRVFPDRTTTAGPVSLHRRHVRRRRRGPTDHVYSVVSSTVTFTPITTHASYPDYVAMFDQLTDDRVIWTSYTFDRVYARTP